MNELMLRLTKKYYVMHDEHNGLLKIIHPANGLHERHEIELLGFEIKADKFSSHFRTDNCIHI